MRLKLLLVLLLFAGGILNAQDSIPYRSLLITEAFIGNSDLAYFELTNVGDETIQLAEFEFGEMRPWGDPRWSAVAGRFFMLPEHLLGPGESYVLSTAREFSARQFAKGLDGYSEKATKDEMWELADLLVHVPETNGDSTDLVDDWGWEIFGDIYSGRSCFFLEHHTTETDSFVVDQVNGWFDGDNELNIDAGGYDIAGVTQASANSYLIRKFSVKTGNLDFVSAAGIGEDDSEWIVVTQQGGVWRDVLWTTGNHGDYNLDENTLESTVADVDFANKVITVPWGTRRGDGIMHLMTKKPGIAWNYHLSPAFEDTLSFAAATGDILEIIVCGNDGDRAMFDIVVAEPTADNKIVVPMANHGPLSWYENANENGILGWPRVTMHASGNDTIWGSHGGIPFATRTDTLMERLDLPANATSEFVWVDGVVRADLKNGDILRVKAADGSTKDYYISVLPLRADHDAYLSAITWPDIPDFYRGIFGWKGDTIPGFGSTVYNYRVQVPLDVDGIPALIAKKVALNSTVQVARAASINGTTEQRTISFTVTAEDDTTINVYTVELVKEKNPANLQPYNATPFLSELVFWEQWSNSFGEICNPGNQPLDLSDYMIAMQWSTDPAGVIASRMGTDEWLERYDKYVPGYKWVDEATWQVTPGILEQDLNVNPIVMPGDVFCFGCIYTDGQTWPGGYVWPVPGQLDIHFNNFDGARYSIHNPWNEEVSGNGSPIRKWHNSNWYMFRILNDSIKQGLKPANDPNDFELVENFGMADGSTWVIGGQESAMITNFIRKPHIYLPNADFEGSFGTTMEDAEWRWTNQAYWSALGVGWSQNILYVGHDIGSHFMNTPTHYMSTVSSVVYKVSEGYSMKETIKGMQPGVTVADFISNLIQPNENQVLKVKAMANGAELAMDALLSLNDTLVVMSADSTNTSKYILEVSEEGLSSNAVLTSARFDITIEQQPKSASADGDEGIGSIAGFEYGTQLNTLIDNITVPAGASMGIINSEGAYVSLKTLNYDTTYIFNTVNDNTFFDVIAEDGVTRIVYQLKPEVSESSAFLTSDLYTVVQKDLLIEFVPRGTVADVFLSNLIPSLGATLTLVDKFGLERTSGGIAQDDKVIVTSPNGMVQKIYYLSMLRTDRILQTTYLAYVLSNSYNVDQIGMNIKGVSGTTTIAEFYGKIKTATGATAVVVDANGVEKTSGTVAASDMVKVTSADGKIVVMYDLTTTGIEQVDSNEISLYPNPTSGKLNISGVEAGNRIQVFNSMGAAIQDVNVQTSIETISLDNQPAGMYMIVISDSNKLIGKYKALKK